MTAIRQKQSRKAVPNRCRGPFVRTSVAPLQQSEMAVLRLQTRIMRFASSVRSKVDKARRRAQSTAREQAAIRAATHSISMKKLGGPPVTNSYFVIAASVALGAIQ